MKIPEDTHEEACLLNSEWLIVPCSKDSINEIYNDYATSGIKGSILRGIYQFWILRRLTMISGMECTDKRELFLTIQLAFKEYKKLNPNCTATLHDLFWTPYLQQKVLDHFMEKGWELSNSQVALPKKELSKTREELSSFIKETRELEAIAHKLNAKQLLAYIKENLINKEKDFVEDNTLNMSPRDFTTILHAIDSHPVLDGFVKFSILLGIRNYLDEEYSFYKHENSKIIRFLDFALEQTENLKNQIGHLLHIENTPTPRDTK